MKITAIIPARYRSMRFEGKPLADILGKPMIQHVYERVWQSKLVDEVIVATDDRRIYKSVQTFGGRAVMTASTHPSGTDRVAEVARNLKSEIIINVQGDEPLIEGTVIDKAVYPLLTNKKLMMSTAITRLEEPRDWLNPNVVKVAVDKKWGVLYFSRAPIPFPRDLNIYNPSADFSKVEDRLPKGIYKHIGIYVYRRGFLLKYCRMKPTPLERLEKLEQLRALENGYRIKAVVVNYAPVSVDTPEDLQKVIALLSSSCQKTLKPATS
jgi:3-deoxy-manno-octulosonate cytidylyltransferase (CMP-KDO synthetase)